MAGGLHCIVDAAIGRRSQRELDNLRQMAAGSGMHVVVAGTYIKAPYPPEIVAMSASSIPAAHKVRYAGVDEATLHKVLVDNPRRFLSFVPPVA